jgi:hypothetical protein
MKTFSSPAAVLGLWLAVSFLLWLSYRLFRRNDGSKQRRAAAAPPALIDEGMALFSALRTRASLRPTAEGSYARAGNGEQDLRDDVRSLLNAIEVQSPYFERVNVARKKLQSVFGLPDFPALSEILQIRRDLWAASEIFLMEDLAALGPELADAKSLTAFQAEARQLLFKDESLLSVPSAADDPVSLRLSVAREDAVAFQAQIEREIAASLERSRFPTPGELIAVPLSFIRGLSIGLRELRHLMGDAAVTAQSLARAMTSKGLKGAAEELRRVRGDMPGQFAAAFERAGGMARQGGQGLKRHYEFVLEAQELRARYAELLARAPDLSEKGKQFLARLELERRAEQFRESSGDVFDRARQAIVVGIAYLIAGLQYVQAKITPLEHKQLAPIAPAFPSAFTVPPAPAAEPPLRALLLPSSAYSGGNNGRASASGKTRGRAKPRNSLPEERPDFAAPRAGQDAGLRDLARGGAGLRDDDVKSAPKGKRRDGKPRLSHSEGLAKTSFKDLLEVTADDGGDALATEAASGYTSAQRTGSLSERLASLGKTAEKPHNVPDAAGKGKSKRSSRLFQFKRK